MSTSRSGEEVSPLTSSPLVPRCEGRYWSKGLDQFCRQTVGVTTWTDVDGKEHSACASHAGGMKRRYPTELPERTGPNGTLGLATPWTRGRFAPADVIEVENAIPLGYRINVIAQNPHRFVVVGMTAHGGEYDRPVELFRSAMTADPFRVALSMCERLALHDDGAM